MTDGAAAARELVTPQRLRAFFTPRSIALVGASDNSGWARFIVASCATTGFPGPLTAVHPRATGAFGLPVVPSLRDLAEPAELAFILTPVQAVEGVLDDMGAAGIPNAVVLASGYREVGEAGRTLEDALLDRAVANGVTMLGPNCLGFVNAHSRSAPYALALPPPLIAGPVGVALQSGALASVVLAFAKAHAIGLSLLTSMGNEAMMKTADVLDYLVEDEATRVICLFLEEIGDPARFAQVAEKADRAGKPIVALKAGSSPAGQQAALAHTGAVAGDDAVVDAVLRQLNVIRVTSLEELLTTGAALGYSRWPRGRRMGVLTLSGGSCDIIADAASARGVAIPDFSAETEAAIAALLPPFASAHNPLDVTGFGVLANLSGKKGPLTAVDHALDIAVQDPNLDFVLFSGVTLPEARPPDEDAAATLETRVDWLAMRMGSAPIPIIPVATTCVNVSDYARGLLRKHGITFLGGLDLGMTALGHALRWLENRGRAGRLGRRGGRDRLQGRAAGGAEDLLGADHPQVRHRRRRPRSRVRGRGAGRLREGARGRPGRAGGERGRRAGDADAHRRHRAAGRRHRRSRVRPGAGGGSGRDLGRGAERHQPAPAPGGRRRGQADARRAARAAAAAGGARYGARQPGRGGRGDRRSRRGRALAGRDAPRAGSQPAMGER